VDDESPICATAQRVLDRLGYRVTDLTMPKMSGLIFAAEVARLRPGIPIILASGYIGITNNADLRRAGIREVVSKPVSTNLYAEVLYRLFQPDATSHSTGAEL
jgi:CheY-like chemotaxis protein